MAKLMALRELRRFTAAVIGAAWRLWMLFDACLNMPAAPLFLTATYKLIQALNCLLTNMLRVVLCRFSTEQGGVTAAAVAHLLAPLQRLQEPLMSGATQQKLHHADQQSS
jgi:hypothetical protein